MNKEEVILPMHRNLGVFTTRDIPLNRLFAQFQGKMSGFTKGRDRSFHFGTMDYNIVGMISHLGPQLGIADGIALSSLLKKEEKRSEEHTSELQSRPHLVCRLLLEKKNDMIDDMHNYA